MVVTLLGSFGSNAYQPDPKYAWPIEFESKDGSVTTLYQPQPESFKDNVLEGRMAVTIKPPYDDLIFGALWFKARMSTDKENRIVVLEKMDILKSHFPDMMSEEKINEFSDFLTAEMESWDLEMSLDRILASLEEVDNLRQLSDRINNDPPPIYFRTTPTVLVIIDGDPILKKDNDSGLEYVLNTPFFIVKDLNNANYYMRGGSFWYVSEEILFGWESTKKVPSRVKKFARRNLEKKESDATTQSYREAPELIVVTKPSELVIVDGEIDYNAIEGTKLLYVANTESDIIMDINSQNHYLLLAGRWYFSKTLQDGDWKFSDPGDLPEDFKNISEDSEMASVRSSIPGTSEAQTSLLEQYIPQTATVDRKEAKLEVRYDGNPQFERIEGTDVAYAINTDKSVLMIDNTYYCVDDAIWFRSDKATGPWEVCVVRPDEIDLIPPESPVYNVKYVYIYDYTPDFVYMGYLPGYTYSYVYGGVVVYGTGYYYQPWYGYYYFPRPITWGYGVHYSPYSGWGFSFGISYGWIGWGFHPYRLGYWGPRGYHSGYRHGYIYGHRSAYRMDYAAGRYSSDRNLYNNRSSGIRQTRTVRTTYNVNNKARATRKVNNIYSDRYGNVYQRNQRGNFEYRSNTRQPQPPRTQPTQRQNIRQLERSYQNRNIGTQNYNRSMQQRSRTTPGRSKTTKPKKRRNN